jgi:chromosome segregation ATPase
MARLLKRLELNGFKSFAQKTTFDLSNGITAIVGPNGSGKSNIIDAIRWLLGEREAKNLRGGKGEDLIFAGTAKRPRVSQAQATLSFENANKFFPIEFSEVAVMRQVNRDGANEYFLNKSEVRLRDIIDFFARARLGARGLVVVTQGNSDMFIRATPRERREMIEEMLGLREYQLKKAEAERRLKNTQINLDKVRALTEEILPHLRSLKRQTGRWEKRASFETELRELENHLFGSELHELHGGIARIDAELEREGKALAGLAKEKTTAEERLKEVEQSQPEERKELQDIKRRTQALIESRSKLQKELGRLEAQIEMAERSSETSSLPASESLIEFMRDIKNRLEAAMGADEEEVRVLVKDIVEEIEDVLDRPKAQQHKRAPAVPSAIAAELEKITAELKSIEGQVSELKEHERRLEEKQEKFYLAFKAAVAAVETAKDRYDQAEARRQQKHFEKERLELRREEWERQVRQAGRLPDEFKDLHAATAEGGRAEIERRIFKLRGDLASIGEIDEALVKEARETETRYEFLTRESGDLEKAKDDLRTLIDDLNAKIHVEFGSALVHINREFEKFFDAMFDGGQAKLVLEKPQKKEGEEEGGKRKPSFAEASAGKEEGEKITEVPDAVKVAADTEGEFEPGIDITLKLPRKRVTSLGMLSGGERSLVGIAALFALVSVSPPPFLVLDEVDAPLDDRNARRFSEMLREFSKQTQFIVVTHNRATMEAADVLYGITMGDDDTSKVVSLKLE